MGASGTAVVANAIDIYADDKDVQQLAAPATQQLFKTSDSLTIGNVEKPQRGANRRSRPSTAHSTSRRRGTYFGTYSGIVTPLSWHNIIRSALPKI